MARLPPGGGAAPCGTGPSSLGQDHQGTGARRAGPVPQPRLLRLRVRRQWLARAQALRRRAARRLARHRQRQVI
eukprot:6127600-Heterocapsa_arctica.AAC.1